MLEIIARDRATPEELAKACNDLYGNAPVPPEEGDPRLAASALARLDGAIAMLPARERKFLDHAFFLKPSLRADERFRLMFLRADSFDARRAATRMGKYFQFKVELFGEDKIVKTIGIDDFTDDERKRAHYHLPYLLPWRDRFGRPIHLAEAGHLRHFLEAVPTSVSIPLVRATVLSRRFIASPTRPNAFSFISSCFTTSCALLGTHS